MLACDGPYGFARLFRLAALEQPLLRSLQGTEAEIERYRALAVIAAASYDKGREADLSKGANHFAFVRQKYALTTGRPSRPIRPSPSATDCFGIVIEFLVNSAVKELVSSRLDSQAPPRNSSRSDQKKPAIQAPTRPCGLDAPGSPGYRFARRRS